MKKITLLLSTLTISWLGFSQAKFYTNNGKQEVTELKVGMSDIKVVIPVPEMATGHDLVNFAIDYIVNDTYEGGGFVYYKEYKGSSLTGKKEISFWIKSPDSESSDFCLKYDGACFEIDRDDTWQGRDYNKSIIDIRVVGKDVDSYKWENGEQRPVYRNSRLASYKINMTYSPISMDFYSQNEAFKIQKFSDGKNFAKLLAANADDGLSAVFSSKGNTDEEIEAANNAVVFEAMMIDEESNTNDEMDMMGGGGSQSAPELSISSIKNSLGIVLMHTAAPGSERYVQRPNAAVNWGTVYNSEEEHIYELLHTKIQLKAQKAKDYSNLANEINSSLNWEKGKIGNLDGEFVTLHVYAIGQCSEDPKTGVFKPKASQVGKTKKLLIFVGEKNGQFVVGSIFKAGNEPLTADEEKFKTHCLNSFEVL